MSTPSSSRTYADHSGELIPSIACVAPSFHVPPRSATSSRRASSQASSESTSTPSRSRTTASGPATASVDKRPKLAHGERQPREVGALARQRAREARQAGDALLALLEEGVDRFFGPRVGRLGERLLGDEPPRGEHVVAHRLQCPALQPRPDREALDLALEPRELQRLAELEERPPDLLDAAPADPCDR